MTSDTETFDYVVVGAGSAGCVVAGRLGETGKYKTLLLEAGGKDTYPWIHIPMGYAKLYANPAVNWCYSSEPEPELKLLLEKLQLTLPPQPPPKITAAQAASATHV